MFCLSKKSNAFLQIESDFAYEKGREGVLYTQWPELSNKLYDLMKTEVKDNAAKELLETLSLPDICEGELFDYYLN